MKITLVVGDVTQQEVDAIVNPANSRLLGGGGADGAIHRAAGPRLVEECRKIKATELQATQGLLPTGQAVMTSGYDLPAKHVIHTVGPIFDSDPKPELSLQNAYLNCLKLAEAKGLRTIAFPSISTGVYGFPIGTAAKIALQTVADFSNHTNLDEVRFVLFSHKDYAVYRAALDEMKGKS